MDAVDGDDLSFGAVLEKLVGDGRIEHGQQDGVSGEDRAEILQFCPVIRDPADRFVTEVDENAISIMLDKISKDDSLGIVGCRIMYYSEKNKINYFGGHVDFTSCLAVHHHLNKEYKEGMEDKFFYTDFITGCCLMIRKEVFDKVGLLPEEYFMYYEDTDFCVNVVDNGYKLGICSDSVIYHKVSSSSGGQASPFSTKWATRNRILFMKKFKKKTKGILTKFIFYSSRIPVALIYIFTGKFKLLKAMNEGIKEGRKIRI